jgi:large subunit ribosomal protein L6
MSRIGKQPVAIPANVKVKLDGAVVRVEGPKGKLELTPHPNMKVAVDDATKAIKVERPNDERQNRALHGLTRKLIANMVEGVTTGFEKRLIVVGVGYQARLDKKQIVLSVGYANQIRLTPPEGISVELGENPPIDGSPATKIIIRGIDKHRVGQFAADVRAVHKPEPYKGKGIRYDYETVRRKEGKSFASGG